MFTHEFWLIFSIGAYFVCEVLPIVRDVMFRNMRPERVTDETRMLKEASHDDTSIAHDDISSHPNLLFPVHNCSCTHCSARRLNKDKCDCNLCTPDTGWVLGTGNVVLMADDQVIAQYTETTYDDDFDVYDRDIEDGF
jgi:hypothetical protein